ncbi:MAG: hypothetical protein JWN94_4042 [Betaproteobacteria bacterium]|nr:hypothetical protein [Betaproteobacteria bacterium]
MIRYTESASKSDLYARVKLAPVNAIQREIAIDRLRQADAITDAIMWVVTATRRLFTRNTGANSLLHNH